MKLKLSAIVALALASSASLSAAEKLTTSTINVYSPTPLPSLGLPLNIIPANIQIADTKNITNQVGVSLADYMTNNLQGVTVTEMGGNPWQPEINFRGYTASPLMGTPQGLSTYVDGVRVNEPFGDVTLWDKIPSFAIGSMQLVPGSNPMYGLNTLGGAIAIQTKSGRDNKGTAAEFEAGSWGRQRSMVQHGGVSQDGSTDYFIGYQHTKDDGWRKYSPSHVNQLFGKLGWQNEKTKIDLAYTGAKNSLTGNGMTPIDLLSGDRDQIYTRPDITKNYYHNLTLNGSHWLNDKTMFSGNAYYRKSNRHTLNGDVYELEVDAADQADPSKNPYGWGIDGGATGFEAKGGAINRTKSRQDNYGLTGQLAFDQDIFGKKNQLITGAGFDYSLIRFGQTEAITLAADSEDLAGSVVVRSTVFDSTRALTGPFDYGRQTTGLTSKQYTASLFATDTLSINDMWHVNAGARYNYTHVNNDDTLRGAASPQTLTAVGSYNRINPTLGLTFKPNDRYSTFVSYSESSRAPTAIELGCSNPANPCLLPSAMADDPPLKQVVAKTYDFGVRGNLSDSVKWNFGAYRAVNHNDIQFTSVGALNGAGYFNNVGRTLRQGFDMGFAGKIEKFTWNTSYSYVDASYDTDYTLVSAANSTTPGSNNDITARKGDRMPAIPEHTFKLNARYQITQDWSVGSTVVAFSDSYAYGNENNEHQANQASCLSGQRQRYCATDSGKIAGYAIMNLDTQYNIGKGWSLFAKANNVFDKEYNLSGRLGQTMFDSNGTYYATMGTANANDGSSSADERQRLMLLPGMPRSGWIGIRYEFGGADKKD